MFSSVNWSFALAVFVYELPNGSTANCTAKSVTPPELAVLVRFRV